MKLEDNQNQTRKTRNGTLFSPAHFDEKCDKYEYLPSLFVSRQALCLDQLLEAGQLPQISLNLPHYI